MSILSVRLYDLGPVSPSHALKDDDTLDLLVFSEDVLCRMEISAEDSKKEYIDAFVSHISDQFKEAMKV